jgi:circadian clock protein KaiC
VTAQPTNVSPTGIAGVDEILRGGLPTGRTTVVVGAPGAGKTVMAMQFLVNGAARFGETGVMVSFEESERSMRANFSTLNWPFAEVLGKNLLIVDGRLPEDTVAAGIFDLEGLIAILDGLVKTHGAKRIALDGIDGLFVYARDEAVSRREIRRLLNWLVDSGLTSIVTIKAADVPRDFDPHLEFTEFAADGVIHLGYRLSEQLLHRVFQVVKMRGASFATGEHSYVISDEGLEVAYTGAAKLPSTLGTARLSTGIERLDRMLCGGYREGTVTLISGLPGTSKTTLSGAFVAAGCEREERALFVGFDEPVEQVLRDLQSVGLRLDRYHDAGLLETLSLNAGSASADEHYLAIHRAIERHRPQLLVIDPITAFTKAGGRRLADIVSERLANLIKRLGITAVFTAVGDSNLGELESTSTRVSTIADNWLHVSFAVQRGERNRTLTIIKSRGTGHSNQTRELVLSDTGLDLKDVYLAHGDVLLGTARLEKERQDAADLRLHEIEAQRAAAALDQRCRVLEAQLERTRGELAEAVEERKLVARHAAGTEQFRVDDLAAVSASRRADPGPDRAAANSAGEGAAE